VACPSNSFHLCPYRDSHLAAGVRICRRHVHRDLAETDPASRRLLRESFRDEQYRSQKRILADLSKLPASRIGLWCNFPRSQGRSMDVITLLRC